MRSWQVKAHTVEPHQARARRAPSGTDHPIYWERSVLPPDALVTLATMQSSPLAARGNTVNISSIIERLLTQQEAADLCGIHLHTIIRARQAGELRFVQRDRLIRIRPSDLQSWLDSHTVGGDA
jgi:excisionase family DNA binding protein